MDFAMKLLWIYPAALMTVWTLLTFVLARTIPLRGRVPGFIRGHVMLLMSNPKDEILYRRPSLLEGLCFLVVGCIPLAGALLVASHCYIYFCGFTVYFQQEQELKNT